MKRIILPSCFLLVVNLFSVIGSVNAQSALYPNEFQLTDVTLLDGPFKKAMDLNIKTLLAYDMPRLLQPYYKQSEACKAVVQ